MELREFNTNQKIYATPEQWDTLDRLVSIIKKGDTNQVVKAVLIDSIDISDHVLHKQFLPIVVGSEENYSLYEYLKESYDYTFELIDQSKLDFDTVVFWKRAE